MERRKARIWQEDMVIPTYEMGDEEQLPIFYRLRINQGTKGDIYPYKNKDTLLMEKNDGHVYRALRMENDFIRVTVLPELGGRIYEGYDKVNDYHFVYKNHVIKPALIGLNGAWISGGIEFNWPQHHRPTTFLPVEATIEEEEDGSVTAWMGETEEKTGQKSLVGVSIHPERSYITAKVKLYNPTPQREAFHWWANLAVHVNDSYRLMFPPDIDYVTFHDKTHVSPFPMVKGEFAGADFGDGVDIRYVKNLPAASSFFIFDSRYSFMAGYDDSIEMGTVHVADRFLSPGKKFFTWGKAGYGKAWQKNLTDADGDYIEIMTGCFTDNQPDFTWIMPYETKTFEQRWYSIKGIRELKNATDNGALGVWKDGEGIKVAFNVTGAGKVTLDVNGETYLFHALPGQVYTCYVQGVSAVDEADIKLVDERGKVLVSWKKQPMFFEGKKPPLPRNRPVPPEEAESVDELWIHGMHIEQYKHAIIKPEIYYLEGLKRDPGDIRCNTAMGILMYRKGDFDSARVYLERALERSVSQNPNPYDTECYYQLGLVYRELGREEEALCAFKKSAWGYAWKSAALQQSAEIECKNGDWSTAADDLEASLETNAHSLRAWALRLALSIRQGRVQEARSFAEAMLAYDPLDAASYYTLYLCGEQSAREKLVSVFGEKTGAWLNLAEIYLSAGLYEEGYRVLGLCPSPTVLSRFYQAWAADKAGNPKAGRTHMEEGERARRDAVFPNRMFDFKVLQYVTEASESALAPYYMGCMFYARENDRQAAACWQRSVSRNPEFADAHRALAQVMFEAYGDLRGAKEELDKAFSGRRDARIFYEKYQLDKVTGATGGACLRLLEENRDLVEKRQDLTVQYIEQLCRLGRLKEAKNLLDKGQFYSYEGGEGHLPGIHAFVHIALGAECLRQGKNEEALEYFRYAGEYPAHYHEGRKYQERIAHLHYFLSLGYEAVGDQDGAKRELMAAAAQYDNQGESQFFKGLALRKLGNHAAAARIYKELETAAHRILKSDTLNYFLGFPAALPYEQSQRRTLEKMGKEALFYAQLGLGRAEEAERTAEDMRRKGLASLWVDYLAGKSSQGGKADIGF